MLALGGGGGSSSSSYLFILPNIGPRCQLASPGSLQFAGPSHNLAGPALLTTLQQVKFQVSGICHILFFRGNVSNKLIVAELKPVFPPPSISGDCKGWGEKQPLTPPFCSPVQPTP